MEHQIVYFVLIFLLGIFLIAHIADVMELREFRSILCAGMKVKIKVDDVWTIATVIFVDYTKPFTESTCNVEFLVNESPCIITGLPINEVYKPNSYRI